MAVTKVFFKTAFHLDVPVGLRNCCMRGRRTTQHTHTHTQTHTNTSTQHTILKKGKHEVGGTGDGNEFASCDMKMTTCRTSVHFRYALWGCSCCPPRPHISMLTSSFCHSACGHFRGNEFASWATEIAATLKLGVRGELRSVIVG